MSSLSACYLVYAALVVPLLGTAVWSVHRHSGPLLVDLLETDEMVVAAVHRLVTVAYALLGLGMAATLVPTAGDVRAGAASAIALSWAGLVLVLGTAHAGLVAAYVGARWRREARSAEERSAPPLVWGPPPVRTAWIPPVPPALAAPPLVFAAAGPVPRPTYIAAPPPPPWCTPVPMSYDAGSPNPWAPPVR